MKKRETKKGLNDFQSINRIREMLNVDNGESMNYKLKSLLFIEFLDKYKYQEVPSFHRWEINAFIEIRAMQLDVLINDLDRYLKALKKYKKFLDNNSSISKWPDSILGKRIELK
jgi:hypothetical protein